LAVHRADACQRARFISLCPVLLSHQKAKHFRCGSCNKQWPNIGAMKLHALKAHGETVLKARSAARGFALAVCAVLRCAGTLAR
jgi:hypothetical protein